MESKLKTFIFYEIGKTCRVEFLMKNGKFRPTEDAVVIGIAEGENADEALENLIRLSPWLKDYVFDSIAVREVRE
jgi:hypothetical protein